MSAKKSVKYSVLDLAFVSQGSTPADALHNSLKLAQAAEEAGYTRFWLAEHHNSQAIASSSPPIIIGYVAGGTKTIRVGSGGVMLPNHSSLVIAEQFGTLAALYPGRIDLGLGRAPGTDQLTAAAIRSDRLQAVYAFPDEIDNLHRYFDAANNNAPVRATIAEGADVPIYILGSTTDSALLAAEKGLPYAFASHFAPAELLPALKLYRQNFKPSLYLNKPYVIAACSVLIADTNEEAEMLSTTGIRMVLGILTNKRDYLQPPSPITDELRELAEHPLVKQMRTYAFIGDKETVRKKTEAFIELTDADEIMVSSQVYDQDKRLRSYQSLAEILTY